MISLLLHKSEAKLRTSVVETYIHFVEVIISGALFTYYQI